MKAYALFDSDGEIWLNLIREDKASVIRAAIGTNPWKWWYRRGWRVKEIELDVVCRHEFKEGDKVRAKYDIFDLYGKKLCSRGSRLTVKQPSQAAQDILYDVESEDGRIFVFVSKFDLQK